MSLRASARRVGDGLRHEVDVNGRHLIVTDEPAQLGGTDTGPAPHELLPAALAACIATMISMYAQTKHWDVGEVVVDVDYDHQAVPRQFVIEVRLPDSLSSIQIERLRRVANTCPLRRALETGFEFDERIVTEPRGPHKQAA
jgi:putative redox protein